MQNMGIELNTEEMPVRNVSEEIRETGKKGNDVGLKWIVLLITVFVIYDVIRKEAWEDFLRIGLITIIFVGLVYILKYIMSHNPYGTQQYLRKLGKTMPILLIILVFSVLLSNFDALRPIATITFLISIIGVLFVFTSLQQYRHLLKPDYTTSDKLEDKIKAELALHNVKNYHKGFPKPLNWIGGFMTPLFPFFTVVNKNWKRNMTQEAFIHEHMHIHLMVYEGWSVYLLLTLLFFPIFTFYVGLRGIMAQAFNFLIFAAVLTFHEKVTFERTQQLAKKFDIVTRPWTVKLARKYMTIYFSWMTIIFTAFYLIAFLIKFVIQLL